jgi:serine/threonine-protein kinase
LVGALVFIVTLVVAGGVAAAVELTRDDKSAASEPSTASVTGADFTGTYRADYGPGTDLEGKPVPNAPATTSNWAARSTCGASGCVATAANISGAGLALLSNLTFDQLGGTWVAVGLASAQCGDTPAELWVVFTLQPHPDGTLSGETTRASTNGACAAKRTVKFTRTGDPDLNKVPDPAVLPPRSVAPAEGLRGSYRQTTTFTDGNVVPGKILAADTYCLRVGDKCMSLFHGPDGVVTLMFAGDKWTRNEEGTTMCSASGSAHVTIAAEYPLPVQLDDPIAVLTGRGEQTVAAGSDCAGGGDFEDRFERTGD